MKLAIIGRPQSGKTTVFNAAAGQQEAVGDYSKATHRALVKVPDYRLDRMAELVKPRKVTYATIEFLDAPGLSGRGKQAGPLEISEDLRQSDAFLMVVNAFSPEAKPEVDIQTLTDEMILLDQVLIEGVIGKRERKIKLTGDKVGQKELDLLKQCRQMLEHEKPLIDCEIGEEEQRLLRGYQFLSQKPLLIVMNIAEEMLSQSPEIYQKHSGLVHTGKRELAVLCGKIEGELVDLDEDERGQFMSELGIATPAVEQVIKKSYALLGLILFITATDPEARAWAIRQGTVAQKAAGVVHTDMERGFIRAEVVAFEDYDRLETLAAIKAAGKHRLEGKDYIVQDGDVILFRFNV
jgi:GTP-binding protein YchF